MANGLGFSGKACCNNFLKKCFQLLKTVRFLEDLGPKFGSGHIFSDPCGAVQYSCRSKKKEREDTLYAAISESLVGGGFGRTASGNICPTGLPRGPYR
jgi:hypothetical protein